jgi:hypothetical protein
LKNFVQELPSECTNNQSIWALKGQWLGKFRQKLKVKWIPDKILYPNGIETPTTFYKIHLSFCWCFYLLLVVINALLFLKLEKISWRKLNFLNFLNIQEYVTIVYNAYEAQVSYPHSGGQDDPNLILESSLYIHKYLKNVNVSLTSWRLQFTKWSKMSIK